MLVTTTEQIAGKSYEILGLAQGSTIQCKNVGRDITQGLKQLRCIRDFVRSQRKMA